MHDEDEEAPLGLMLPWARVMASALQEQRGYIRAETKRDIARAFIRAEEMIVALQARLEQTECELAELRQLAHAPRMLPANHPPVRSSSDHQAKVNNALRRIEEGVCTLEDLAEEWGCEPAEIAAALMRHKEQQSRMGLP